MKIAIAGYGVEGEANYNYWTAQPGADLTIVDESKAPKYPLPTGVKTILGIGAFEKLNGFDLVVRTAGLSPRKIKTDGTNIIGDLKMKKNDTERKQAMGIKKAKHK